MDDYATGQTSGVIDSPSLVGRCYSFSLLTLQPRLLLSLLLLYLFFLASYFSLFKVLYANPYYASYSSSRRLIRNKLIYFVQNSRNIQANNNNNNEIILILYYSFCPLPMLCNIDLEEVWWWEKFVV